jgi:predicted amidohydrolase YtcJ
MRSELGDDPMLRTGIVKMFADGVIESKTAAMLAPYVGTKSAGVPNMTDDEMRRIVAMFDRRGWQVQIHAIGDRAIRMALDAFEAAAKANPAPARGRRHRLEHVESIAEADIARFGALGVIASQQPYHGTPVVDEPDIWSANLGPVRASRGWASRSIADAGGRIAFGSDWPVMTLDPRYGLYTAVMRQTPDGRPADGWNPEERLALPAAIDAYTSGAAYASFDEHRKGRLERDMLADIVILSSDIFAPDARILDAVVDTTIFDGKVVYTRTPATTD